MIVPYSIAIIDGVKRCTTICEMGAQYDGQPVFVGSIICKQCCPYFIKDNHDSIECRHEPTSNKEQNQFKQMTLF